MKLTVFVFLLRLSLLDSARPPDRHSHAEPAELRSVAVHSGPTGALSSMVPTRSNNRQQTSIQAHSNVIQPSENDANVSLHGSSNVDYRLISVEPQSSLQIADRTPGKRSPDNETSNERAIEVGREYKDLWKAPLCTALLSITVFWLLWQRRQSVSPDEIARNCMQLFAIVSFMVFAAQIPDSLVLARCLGKDVAWSGFMIGIFFFGSFGGCTCMSLVLRKSPELLRMAVGLTVVGSVLGVVACAVYIIAVRILDNDALQTSPSSQLTSSNVLAGAIVSTRFVFGFCHGLVTQAHIMIYNEVTPLQDRQRQYLMLQTGWQFGGAVGPVMASLGQATRVTTSATGAVSTLPLFQVIGFMSAALYILAAVCFVVFYPRWEDTDNLGADADGQIVEQTFPGAIVDNTAENTDGRLAETTDGEVPPNQDFAKTVVVISALFLSTFRAWTSAGLEVATSLLLEDKYKIPQHSIGAIIGASFFLIVPVSLLQFWNHDQIHVCQWVRLCTAISTPACCLLFDLWTSGEYTVPVVAIIVADCIVYPAMNLSEGLVSGIMFQHVLPDGSCLNLNTVTLLSIIVIDGVSRFLGPWYSRWVIDEYGQNAYAGTQLCLITAYVFVFELLLARFMVVGKESDAMVATASK